MSDQEIPSTSNEPNQEQEDNTGRAKPFLHAELVDMVRYLQKRSYDAPEAGTSYRRKTNILQKLSRKLEKRYGTTRNPRQLQKRFSDLKVRQPKLLKEIYAEIKHPKGQPAPFASQAESHQGNDDFATSTCPVTLEEEVTHQDMTDEMVTLTLLPVEPEKMEDKVMECKATQTEANGDLYYQMGELYKLMDDLSVKMAYVIHIIETLSGN